MKARWTTVTGSSPETCVRNGQPLPLTLERAKPETAAALDPAIEAQKDYSYTGPNDLPGHWQGTLDVKQSGVKLRLAVNIAKLPDGKFSATMISLDQGGAEIPANTVQYFRPMCAWNGVPSAAPSTENLKTAKSPAPGGRAVERSRWCWKGTGHNDLANHPIEEMEFDFLSDLAGWRRFSSVEKNEPWSMTLCLKKIHSKQTTSPGIHLDRTAGGHCHHRHPLGAVVARLEQGQEPGQPGDRPQQPQGTDHRHQFVLQRP
jgi:hypothetical protein